MRQVKMNDFSSCCASSTFTIEMAIASPFSLLEYAIALEAISRHSCFKEYLKTANNYTMQSSSEILAELKTRFRNNHVVELDIASKEEIKYIELHITDLLSKRYA
ncbi:hypothetical protein Ahy_A02g007026 [Arachis hypogaea]|uniref:Uncharacterized protein n=1 Tax=Arachis hypogaea TaxID=3818 RepID=A0A445EBE2_ARAHY|nr:hypothetical protein Ahy_A02g007026 [Arachis hypogaea]